MFSCKFHKDVSNMICECWYGWWSGADQVTSHYLNQWWLVYWSIYVSLGLNVNSLGPSDAIWWQRSGSTVAQEMACCLTAPSHYLNRCWLIISKAQWHSYKGNLTRDAPNISHLNPFENYVHNISFKSPRSQWVKLHPWIKFRCANRFHKITSTVLVIKKVSQIIINNQRKFAGNMSDVLVITVPADVLALRGDKIDPSHKSRNALEKISHNAPFCKRCAHLCYKIMHSGIWDWCIVGIVHVVCL